jgi:uncharacterized protein (TIGR02246 family)
VKTLLLPALLLVLLANSSSFAFQNPEDAAIQKRHDEWVAAWGKHDAKLMASLFVADADLINPFGRKAKGTAEIEKLFTEEHAGPMAKSTYSGKIESIRYIGTDVAIVDVDGEVKGIVDKDGASAPPLKHHVTWIATKKDGKWMAVGARAFVAAAPPAAPAK